MKVTNLDGKDVYPFFQGASNNNSSYYTETMAFINECAPDANVHDGLYAAASDTAKIDAYLDAIDFSPKADLNEPTPAHRQTIYLWDDDKIPSWRGNLNDNDPEDFPSAYSYISRARRGKGRGDYLSGRSVLLQEFFKRGVSRRAAAFRTRLSVFYRKLQIKSVQPG